MVVNHVHNNADAVCVQGFYHLLHFFYPHFPVCRVGGVGAFRHIVIDRVIAPVKLFGVDIALVHGTEIIDRKQMHMGNAKFFDMVKTGCDTGRGFGAGFGKSKEFPLVCNAGVSACGEVAHMQFVNNRIVKILSGIRVGIGIPAIRVC